MVAAGYKWMFGPYSLGFLYVAPRHQQGRPIEEGWVTRRGAEDFRRLAAYEEALEPDARRFTLTGRATAPIGRKLSELREVLVGVQRPAPSEDDSDKPHFASLSEFIEWKLGSDDFEGDP